MRVIEVVADAGHVDTLLGIAEQYGATDVWTGATGEDGRSAVRILVDPTRRQDIIDALQNVLGTSGKARIVILPVEATLPRPVVEAREDTQKSRTATTREELYHQIEKGARLDGNFLLMVFLSTIVAAIGLIEDNVAVVVGAMVIAPLLGPNIALAFAGSLGDTSLMWQSLKTNLAGLTLTFAVAAGIGVAWPASLDSHEIVSRTNVDMSSVALALASGAAAVLSLTAGLSTVLVGVMVAVALLPPAATFAMLSGSGQLTLAQGAALLLAVNIVCVILSAKLVFLLKGVKPRTWLERQKARQSSAVNLLFWAILLVFLIWVIVIRK